MTPSWRKPAGVFAILAMIAIWAVVIASMSGTVGDWHWSAQMLFYVITGLVWIAPLKPLLHWTETGRWR